MKKIATLFTFKIGMILLSFLGSFETSQAQTYFRSRSSTNWNLPTTWDSSSTSGATWFPSSSVPTAAAGFIGIMSGNTVTINDGSQTMNNVFVQGTLLFATALTRFTMPASGSMSIATNGSVVFTTQALSYATLVASMGGGVSIVINSGGKISVGDGSTYIGDGMNSFATTNSYIWNTDAIFEWNATIPFPTANVTYFPNAAPTTIPIFRLSAASPGPSSYGSPYSTKIYGVFELNIPLDNWEGNGPINFRNGIVGTGRLRCTSRYLSDIRIGDSSGIANTTAKIGCILAKDSNGFGDPDIFDDTLKITITTKCVATMVDTLRIDVINSLVYLNVDGVLDAVTQQISGSNIWLTVNGMLRTSNNNGLSGSATTTLESASFITDSLTPGSTIEYYSTSAQVVSSRADYQNLVISGGSVKTIDGNTVIADTIKIVSGNKLSIAGNTLTLNGRVSGTGTLTGSNTSNLTIGGTAGSLYFTTGTTNNYLKDFTITGSATLATALNITAGSSFGSVTTTGGTLGAAGFLTLKSDANGTARVAQITTGTINGTVTIERFIPSKRAWRLLTHSLSTSTQTINQAWQEGVTNTSTTVLLNPNPGYGTQITRSDSADVPNGYDANLQANPSLKVWNGTALVSLSATTIPITTYNGYFIFVRGNRTNRLDLGTAAPTSTTTLRTTGTLNQGAIGQGTFATAGQYALIGNLYASSINIANILTRSSAIIDPNTFVLWDPGIGLYGAYITHLNGVSAPLSTNYPTTASTFVMQSGQAFFVKALVNNPSVSFLEADKVATASSSVFARRTSVVRANLISSANTLLDGIAIGFTDGNASSVPKWGTLFEGIALSRPGTNLSIQSQRLPVFKSDTFFVEFAKLKSQDYSLDLSMEHIPMEKISVTLIDKFLQTTTALGNVSKYGFSVDLTNPQTYKGRFSIVVRPIPTAVVQNDVRVYPNPVRDQFRIEGAGILAPVTIYNALGVVMIETMVNDGLINCSSLPHGLYIIKIGDHRIKCIKQ